MSDIISAISEDIDEYLKLCRKYGEAVHHSHDSPDCYGEHAKSLKKRVENEWKKRREQEVDSMPEVREYKRMLREMLGRLEEMKLLSAVTDPETLSWWKKNRKEYDEEQKRMKADAEQRRVATKARGKLTARERQALNIR